MTAYPLSAAQADNSMAEVQASAELARADALLVAGELTVIEAYLLACAHGMHLVQHRRSGRMCITPVVTSDWRKFPMLTPPEQATTFFPRMRACAA